MKHRPEFDVQPLIAARKKIGWTTTELAARIGRSDSMVRLIEAGKNKSFTTIFRMSEELKVPMSKVLINRRAS